MSEGRTKSIHDDSYRILVELLRAERESAGITQTDLAVMIGADQSFVSKYERCERRVDLIEVRQLCQAMGVDLQKLLARFETEIERRGL